METTVSGKTIVTPRGWEDLSKMLLLYEKHGIKIDEDLIVQYLQNAKIAREFSVYLDLYNKYRTEYPIDEMLSGYINNDLKNRISEAGFDEIYTLIGLLLSNINSDVRACMEEHRMLESVRSCIKQYRQNELVLSPKQSMDSVIENLEKERSTGLRARSLTREEGNRLLRTVGILYDISDKISESQSYEGTYELIRGDYSDRISDHSIHAEAVRSKLDNLFAAAEELWGDGKEMLLILTELTADPESVGFISTYGCDAYYKHNRSLLFNERDIEIEEEIRKLEL